MEATLTRWLADADTFVGIFENTAFDSADFGRRVGLPFALSDFDTLKPGDRAPDTSTLIGWKYTCIGKAKTVEEAMAFFNRTEA
jgi:hypothetical protein